MNDDQLADIRNRKIGFVFQSFNLLPRTSALENVELPLIYAGVRDRRRQGRGRAGSGRAGRTPAPPAERAVRRPAAARGHRPRAGERPGIILADEPTGNLDSKAGAEVMGIFQKLNVEHGMTVILVTHEPDIADTQPARPARFRRRDCPGRARR